MPRYISQTLHTGCCLEGPDGYYDKITFLQRSKNIPQSIILNMISSFLIAAQGSCLTLSSSYVSVADSGAASQGGCGLSDRPQARDVLSLSHFSLQAQLCKWLTAYIQNVNSFMKHGSHRHWACAGHAMITRQQVNTHVHCVLRRPQENGMKKIINEIAKHV